MSDLAKFNGVITSPKTQDYLMQVLGDKKSSFVNNITALVSNNKNLQECEPVSLMYAGIKATALDLPLDPNLGFAYVIPFKNNRENKTEAQFQIGYKGFIQLAMRTGQFKTINVRDVREGEITGEDFVSGELQFKKLNDNREGAKVIGYVAYFRLLNGFEKMIYWTVSEIETHGKKYSQTFSSTKDYVRNSSKWTTDFDAMAKKTVIKLLLSKYAPLSIEMQGAITSDQTVIDDKGCRYVDNDNVGANPCGRPDNAEQNEKVAAMFSKAFDENIEEAEVVKEELKMEN
jgi:recombination protein RecT